MNVRDVDVLRALVATAPELITIYDLEARVLHANAATEATFGSTLAEMKGKVLFDLFPETRGSAFHAAFERVARTGRAEAFRHYHPRFDRWFDSRIERIDDRAFVVARDVTGDVRRRRRLEALARISALVTREGETPSDTTQAITFLVSEVLDAHTTVALRSSDGAWLEVVASVSRDASTRALVEPVSRWPADVGNPGEALRTRTSVLRHLAPDTQLPDLAEDPLRGVVERFQPASVLAVPLVVGDQAIGVLVATRRRGSPRLTEDDRLLASEIAPTVGLHVAHARRRAESAEVERARRDAQARATHRLETLLALTARLAAASDQEEIARVLVDQGVGALDAALGGLWILSPDRREFVQVRESGLAPEHQRRFVRFPVGGVGPMTACVEEARPVFIESRAEYVRRFPEYEAANRPEPPPPIAFALLPLMIEGQAEGCLNFTFHDERRLTPDEKTYLELLAAHGAEALRRARLHATRETVDRENGRLMEEAVAARREAEEASRAKDEFLAMLGHELRNPLAPIATALELMRMQGAGFARERAVVERQVEHLTRLVDDLLEVSRITRGKVELRRQPTPLAATVARVLESTGPLLESRRHRVSVQLDDGLSVDADPTRLEQIVANLVTNAAKYTPPGGHIEIRGEPRAEDVVISVRDDGVGIAPEMLPRVFDMFVQAEQSRARTEGGLGLGLAIVKNLVELHGGSLCARSEGLGKGAEMVVVLPRGSAPPADVAPAPASSKAPGSGRRRILVVDDNEDAACLLRDVLVANGHDARSAFDAPTALELARSFSPELAVLDIGLPVMDGYELAERLRALGVGAKLRLIAVTGYGQKSDRERSKQAGFEAHLAKPITVSALLALVNGA